jgi:hypothetical protein
MTDVALQPRQHSSHTTSAVQPHPVQNGSHQANIPAVCTSSPFSGDCAPGLFPPSNSLFEPLSSRLNFPGGQRLPEHFQARHGSTIGTCPKQTPQSVPAHSNENNAERMSAREMNSYAQAGYTNQGNSYAGAAIVSGRDPDSGIFAEIGTVSAQAGLHQVEVQGGLARVGGQSDDGQNSVSAEFLTGRFNLGTHNDDGSKGLNVGGQLTIAAYQETVGVNGNGLTVGVSAGIGAAGSAGYRDADGDGYRELCKSASVMFLTFGTCIEENPIGWFKS